MKQLLYTFLAVSIIFSSCKKENNNSCQLLESVLDKTWTGDEIEIMFNSDGTITCSGCEIDTFDVDNPDCTNNSYTMNDIDVGAIVVAFSSITNTSCLMSIGSSSVPLYHTP